MRVGAGTEVGVEDIGVRPEFEREAKDFEDVAAHALAGFFRGCGEGREFVEGGNFLAGIGRDQAEAAVDGVTVGIDEAGEESLAFEIDALGVGRDGLRDFGEVADREDLVSANGNCFRVGILRVGGEDLGVEEDAVGGGSPELAGEEHGKRRDAAAREELHTVPRFVPINSAFPKGWRSARFEQKRNTYYTQCEHSPRLTAWSAEAGISASRAVFHPGLQNDLGASPAPRCDTDFQSRWRHWP